MPEDSTRSGPDGPPSAASIECYEEPSLTPNLIPNSPPVHPHLSTLHCLNRVNCQTSWHIRVIDRMQRHRYWKWILHFRQCLWSQFLLSDDDIPIPTHKGDIFQNLDLRCDLRYSHFNRPRSFLTRLFSLNTTSKNEGDMMVFDTESIPFAIDPCATATIFNSKDHPLYLHSMKNSSLLQWVKDPSSCHGHTALAC